MSLRQKLASFGFESNDDYEYALRLLFEAKPTGVRCLNIVGESGRRKTAFAHALASALEYPHILYHDFTQVETPTAAVMVDAESGATQTIEAAVTAFDRAVTEACAYSEGARVALILDQIQASEFQEQIRLYQFAHTREWSSVIGQVMANPSTLLLILISETPLYHSLQKLAFKVWADTSGGFLEFDPKDFGLGVEFQPVFRAFGEAFRELGQAPTQSEFAHIVDDLVQRVRTLDHLRTSLYGWMENLDRDRLMALQVSAALEVVVELLSQLYGVEEIEIRHP